MTLVVIAAVVWTMNRQAGASGPTGKIGKVRVQNVDEKETVIVFDFNLRNDSDRPVTVQSIDANLDAADGSTVEGSSLSSSALANVFHNYPALGDPYNPTLKALTTIPPHQSLDGMAGIRFDVPEETVLKRKDVVLRIQNINGPTLMLTRTELKAK